jgi:hypothetical protein
MTNFVHAFITTLKNPNIPLPHSTHVATPPTNEPKQITEGMLARALVDAEAPVSAQALVAAAAPPAIRPEVLIKHPLEYKWAMWYFKNDKTKGGWEDFL